MHEVAEQIKSLKEDMEQKDLTIAKLRSENSQLQAKVRSERESHSLQTLCSQILQHLDGSNASGVANDHLPQLAIERASALSEERKHLSRQVADLRTRAEEASSELAAERVHTTSQQNELKQTKGTLSERQQQVEQLRSEVERLEQNSARQTSLVQSLRQQVQELDNERSHKSGERLKFDTTISELRQETHSQKRQITEKQQQLELQLETVKATEQKAAKITERYERLCSSIGELLEVEGAGLMTSLDDVLISKVTEVLQENNDLRSQQSSLKSSLEACDMDARAGRETIMRLVSEVSKEQKVAVNHQEDKRKLQLVIS
jgi:chromosome segregation protein